MNEEAQAELLAAWLAGEHEGIPEGLDPDVVEATLSLRPELAPPPALTADDILASVTTGPLAGMPTGASLAEPPQVPEPSNRSTWIALLLGAGGMSAMAAAAGLLLTLTVLTTRSTPDLSAAPMMESPAVQRVARDGVAVLDSGMPNAAPAAKQAPARPRMAARPRPRPRPDLVAPSPAPVAFGGASPAPAEEPAAELDAVAFAEDEVEEEAEFADDFEEEKRYRTMALASEREQGTIPEASLGGGSGGPEAARGFAFEADAEAPPPPVASAPASADRGAPGRRRPSKEAKAEEALAPYAPEGSIDDGLRDKAHRQTRRASHPQLTAARAALDSGDLQAALAACEAGLANTSGDTLDRQALFAVKGDILAAMGNPTAARQAWTAAEGIRQRR